MPNCDILYAPAKYCHVTPLLGDVIESVPTDGQRFVGPQERVPEVEGVHRSGPYIFGGRRCSPASLTRINIRSAAMSTGDAIAVRAMTRSVSGRRHGCRPRSDPRGTHYMPMSTRPSLLLQEQSSKHSPARPSVWYDRPHVPPVGSPVRRNTSSQAVIDA